MTSTETNDYVLADAGFDDELARLRLLEGLCDATTASIFDRLAVQPGWRCLEIGAGAGSAARLLADRVGPSGRVTAVDLNTRFLAALDDERIEVQRADVRGGLASHGSFSVVDFATRRVIATWKLPGTTSLDMGGISPDGKTLWVSGRRDRKVYAIDIASGRVVARIKDGAGPHGLCVWPQPGRYSLGHTGILR